MPGRGVLGPMTWLPRANPGPLGLGGLGEAPFIRPSGAWLLGDLVFGAAALGLVGPPLAAGPP